ncbi:MAG: hypothetical protein MUF54_09340 [Polyangiaceae bacterium]|jgi:hypothetical protein|nr:hypothetical protein [Polyangiaceae bacterium]
MFDNRRAVALGTLRAMHRWVASGVLDGETVPLLERVLEGSRRGSLAVWVHDLARLLGAPPAEALRAATCADLLYAGIDFTDDVQDGDAPARLPDVAPALCVNAAAHLLVVGLLAVCEWDAGLGARISALVSGMFCGQRLELTREGWGAAAYERMARATGGLQVEAYTRLAARAAQTDPASLVPACSSIGLLLHIQADRRSNDERLMALRQDEVEAMQTRARRELALALEPMAPAVAAQMNTLLG